MITISSKKRRSEFAEKLKEIGGESMSLCYQCGQCSATCPMSFAMDIPPRKIIHLVQLGLEQEIATSKTMWVCASCFECSARCPRGVDIAKIMEVLRLMTLRKSIDHVKLSDIPQDRLAELPQIALVSCLRKLTA